MNSRKLVFAIMIILQTITIGLLCYDSFLTEKPSVCPSVGRDISELGPEVSGNGDDYGLRAEDAKRMRNALSERRTRITSFHVSNSLKEGPVFVGVYNLAEQLHPELQRYQSMSDEEKREFEKKLAHRIMMSEQMKELLHKIGQTMRDIAEDRKQQQLNE